MDVTEFDSQFIVANNIKTHFLQAGSRSNPTTLLVHGGGAGADAFSNWRGVMRSFAEEFNVIAVDMLGFGQTDKPDPNDFEYSQSARNKHLVAFIEALGCGPVNIVGNSMGGATGIGVAVEKPELINNLVLMGSAGLNAELSPALMPIVQYDFTKAGMVALIDALTGDNFQIDDELVSYRHERSCEPSTRAAYAATMGWIKKQGGLCYEDSYIQQVRCRTLVVNGKQDLVVPLANAYRFLELIDNSSGYIIPHCGHWAMVEAPEVFTATTKLFLQDSL